MRHILAIAALSAILVSPTIHGAVSRLAYSPHTVQSGGYGGFSLAEAHMRPTVQ